jgi:hypothetical protein
MVIVAAAQHCELRSRTANSWRSFKLLPYNKLIIKCARLIEAASSSTKYCEVICSGGMESKMLAVRQRKGPTIRVKIIKIKKSGLLIICIETWRCPEVYLNAEV